MTNSKNSFWQAFIVAVFIFLVGLVLGFYIELSNVGKSDLLIRSSEVNLLDQQTKILSLSNEVNFNCESARKNLFKFADEIYIDALNFEEEDAQSKLTEDQREILHKRYDLLRVNLWLQSLKLRGKCDNNFHTVLYLFDYKSKDAGIKSEQTVMSLVLLDLKNKYPNEILLLPIAANLDLGSVDIIKENYNISESPSVIIDESIVLDSVLTLDELEKRVFDGENYQKVIILKP